MPDSQDPDIASRSQPRRRYRGRRKRRDPKPRDETPLTPPPTAPTLDDKLATLDVNLDESDGEDCELHTYEYRYNSHGDEVMLRVGTSFGFEREKQKSHRAALVLFRTFDRDQELLSTYIEIRSVHIKTALQSVVVSYPGVDIQTTGYITIWYPPKCLFHYREELKQYAEQISNPDAKDHIYLLIAYIYRTLKFEILSFEAMTKPESELMVEHKNLWCVFKPGALIYSRYYDLHLQGDEKFGGGHNAEGLFRLVSVNATYDELLHDTVKYWAMTLEYIDYDGEDYAYADIRCIVHKYDGLRCLKDINPIPLEFHPDAEQITKECLQKGRKFVSLCGTHYRFATGVGRYQSHSRSDSKTLKRMMEHRIMIDFASFWQSPAARPQWVSPYKRIKAGDNETLELSDEQLSLCTSSVPGYSLTLREWGIFDVDAIQDVVFNMNAFNQLCIPEERKDLILSLVSQHHNSSSGFDDIIQGKGKGLIFLLHGPPGVGKTLTAGKSSIHTNSDKDFEQIISDSEQQESIADHTRRPLLAVGSGDILEHPKHVELLLKDIFQQTNKWGALLLIDEADVFLQQRDMLSLERNGLVSVMLRVLEYFEGILFLTTNRVETIDTAFRSRIHLALYYPPLSTVYLRKLWKNTIFRGCSDQHPTWLTEELLDFLSQSKVNGRDIKNIVRMAHARATNNERRMEAADITTGLKALEEFSEDFYKQNTNRAIHDVPN